VRLGETLTRSHCIPCLISKGPQQLYTHHGRRASVTGELLYMDTCGPFPALTPQKHSSFLSILEDCTNSGFVGLLSQKSDAFKFYCTTEANVEHVSGLRVLTVWIDGAPKLCEGCLDSHLCGHGISLQITAPYAHSQNEKAECYIQTLEDGMQTLIADSGLSPSFWGDAVCTSTLPSDVTPFEAFKHCKPDLTHLRV
jgi:hypothetical protein